MGFDDVSWACSCVCHWVEGLLGMANLGWLSSAPHNISSPSRPVQDCSHGEGRGTRESRCVQDLRHTISPAIFHWQVRRQPPDSRGGEIDSVSWWLAESHCKVLRELQTFFCSQSTTRFSPIPKSRWRAVAFSNILDRAHFPAFSPLNATSLHSLSASYWLGRYNGSRIRQIKECLLFFGVLKFRLLVHWLHL